jgi:hypothetical protein
MSTKADYNNELKNIVEEKKTEWAQHLKDLSPLIRSKNPHDMTDASALALSYRTMILEEVSYFLNELASEQKIVKELRRDKFILYTTGLLPDGTRPTGNILNHPLLGNSKISGGQKDMVISGDLADYEHTAEILGQTVDFLRECIKTIDQYMYSIKNRLELFAIFK